MLVRLFKNKSIWKRPGVGISISNLFLHHILLSIIFISYLEKNRHPGYWLPSLRGKKRRKGAKKWRIYIYTYIYQTWKKSVAIDAKTLNNDARMKGKCPKILRNNESYEFLFTLGVILLSFICVVNSHFASLATDFFFQVWIYTSFYIYICTYRVFQKNCFTFLLISQLILIVERRVEYPQNWDG